MKLRLAHPDAGECVFTIGSRPIVLGRDRAAVDVELGWDTKVSRRHARVWLEEDGQARFEDLDSRNGSWIGRVRVEGTIPLARDTRVRIGETILSLVSGPDEGADPGALRIPSLVSGPDEGADPGALRIPSLVSGPDEGANLEGMTIQMTAEARFEGVGELVGRLAAERVAGFLEALHEVSNGLLHSVAPESLGGALRVIFRVVPAAQRIYVVRWPVPAPEAGDIPWVVSEHALAPDAHPVPALSRSLAEHAAGRRKAMVFFHEAPAGSMGPTESMILHRIHSAVYVPLVEGGERVSGLLCVDTSVPSTPFRPEDFQFIRAVADLLTAALEADRLRREAVRREVEGREWKARRDSMAAFLRIASHDLKTPLTVIQMAAYTLKLPRGEALREFLADQMNDASHRARALIDSYLEVCAVESGQALEIDPEEVDARALVDEEIGFIRSSLPKSRHDALACLNLVECGAVRADRGKLRQVLSNLLSNAVKYSPAGGTVTVSSAEVPEGVVFTVRDEGVGISVEDQARLFEQFHRVGDRSVASGTGLGLWMTRALVEAHGGWIRVESEPGRGSAFSFLLPQAAPA